MKKDAFYETGSHLEYALYDKVLHLIIFESDNIRNIQSYIELVIQDFGVEALSDTLLYSKKDGIVLAGTLQEYVNNKVVEENKGVQNGNIFSGYEEFKSRLP